MSGIAAIKSFLRGSTPPQHIHPGEWPAESDKPRVLIENPNRADLWAHANLLREAGYDVAMCGGPTPEPERVPWYKRLTTAGVPKEEREERLLCPLVAEGHCPLVEGADVVVSTTQLIDSHEIHAKLRARTSPVLVVEGTSSELAERPGCRRSRRGPVPGHAGPDRRGGRARTRPPPARLTEHFLDSRRAAVRHGDPGRRAVDARRGDRRGRRVVSPARPRRRDEPAAGPGGARATASSPSCPASIGSSGTPG